MSKVLILAEGQAEETFINELLAPHLEGRGIYPVPKLATTKRVKVGADFKGGIVSYGKVKNDISRLLHDTSAVTVTTMIDFYGLPSDFPGMKTMRAQSCYDQVTYLERKFREDINHRKFLPYLALHEFEAMLFVSPEKIAQAFSEGHLVQDLRLIREQFASPEEINNNPATHPSRRLELLLPSYQKPLHGPLVLLEIGIDRIRSECSHFNEWLTELENIAVG